MLGYVALVSPCLFHNRPDGEFASMKGVEDGEPSGIRKDPEPRGGKFESVRWERQGPGLFLDWHCYMVR